MGGKSGQQVIMLPEGKITAYERGRAMGAPRFRRRGHLLCHPLLPRHPTETGPRSRAHLQRQVLLSLSSLAEGVDSASGGEYNPSAACLSGRGGACRNRLSSYAVSRQEHGWSTLMRPATRHRSCGEVEYDTENPKNRNGEHRHCLRSARRMWRTGRGRIRRDGLKLRSGRHQGTFPGYDVAYEGGQGPGHATAEDVAR